MVCYRHSIRTGLRDVPRGQIKWFGGQEESNRRPEDQELCILRSRLARNRGDSRFGPVDLRFALDKSGELYLLSKSDGMIRADTGAVPRKR